MTNWWNLPSLRYFGTLPFSSSKCGTSHLNTYFERQTDLVWERRVWLVGVFYNSFSHYFWSEDMAPLTVST